VNFELYTAYEVRKSALSKWCSFWVWIGWNLKEDSWWRMNSLELWGPPIVSIQRSPLLQTYTIGSFWKLGGLLINDFLIILLCYVILAVTDLRLGLTATWCTRNMGCGSGTPFFWLIAVTSRILKGLPTLQKLPEFQEIYRMLLPIDMANLELCHFWV
jgi:hypothetical protein